MKKVLLLMLSLILLLGCAACGKGGDGPKKAASSNTLWEAASPETSVLTLYYYDGEAGWSGWTADRAEEEAILEDLSKVSAEPVKDWSPAQVTWPLYGLAIGTEDGNGIRALWSNGCLIMRDGSVYEFDYDFAALEQGTDWEHRWDFSSIDYMPNSRSLAEYRLEWLPEYMTPAETPRAPEGVSMELKYAGPAKAVAELKNNSGEEWIYGEYFSLQVLLKGRWYQVPALPDENWAFNDIAYSLPKGESREETYRFLMYGALPSGTYRLVVEGLSAEFEL